MRVSIEILLLDFLFITGITIYHALTDGSQFDYVEVLTSDEQTLRCDFEEFLDGHDFEHGKNCRIL